MIYGSVCSGIEAASVAWHPLGWRASFLSEIDAFPRAVLAHHYPDVPLHGDFTTIEADQYEPIDLLVGGTPCQSFSVAGLRGGLADDRGNLALEYLRLADRLRPRWLVWENVPGVLSSNGGRDFGSILRGMVELGYGFAYRVLNAQFFGVPQRRRRVFVVGYLGDWRPPAAVLFERHSLQGHPAPRRQAREGTTAFTPGGFGEYREGFRTLRGRGGDIGDGSETLIARCDTTGEGSRYDAETTTLVTHSQAVRHGATEDGTGRGTPLVAHAFDAKQNTVAQYGDVVGALDTQGHSDAVAIPLLEIGKGTTSRGVGPNGSGIGKSGDPMFTLQAGAQHGIGTARAVRRLTPREAERLQGFPDDWTLVPYRGKPAADSPRYRAIGNSMAVPCMRWIGERISRVRDIITGQFLQAAE